MKNAESVTFGGSGLNRAAELRADVSGLLADPRSTVVVLWRGKPLIAEPDTLAQLVRLPLDHPVLELAKGAPIFLGIEDTGPVFAQDISAWHPEALDDATLNAFTDPSRQQHPLLPEAQFVELRMVMNALSPRDAELVATARALFNWHRSHRFCAQCGQPSDMAMAGWQRNCGKCGASHFPRTDPV
jgi:NAD+ diphosphatase